MNSANYFILDALSGKSNEHIQVFRYTDVKVDNLNANYVEFPISVSFDSNEIRFVYHQNECSEAGNPTCHNVELFHLKLDNHAEDQLEATIYEIFSGSIGCKPFESNKKYSKDNERIASIHYSGLNMFSREANKQLVFNEKKVSLKDLLLDFLFDVYHSDVFDNNPELDALKTSLENSRIMKSLVAKAEFYYYSKMLSEVKREDKNAVSFYRNLFLQSKYNWCTIIRDIESVETFRLNNYWFQSHKVRGIEQEMLLVHKSCINLKEFFKKGAYREETNDNYFKNLNQQISAANYKWYLRRYNLYRAASTVFRFPLLPPIIIIILTLIAIGTISFLLNSKSLTFQFNNSADLVSFIGNLISVFVIVSVGYFAFNSMFKKHERTGLLNLLIPRVLLSMIPTLLFGLFAVDIYSIFWNVSIIESIVLLLMSMFVTVLFINNEARSMAPDVRSFHLMNRSLGIVFITLIFSVSINYYAHARYLGKMHDYSGVVEEFTKEIITQNQKDSIFTESEISDLINLLNASEFTNKKEQLTEKMMQYRDMGKIDFPVYKLQITNSTIPWKWLIKEKESLLFVPGFFILSCVLSILFSVVIQLILDERAVTEPL